jgi:DNA-3-methyladenine glycosylase II
MVTLPARTLTEHCLIVAAGTLGRRDPALAASVGRFGRPPLWARDPGFASLVHLILEQQVSLASARAAFDRLVATLGTVKPQGFLSLADHELRAIGFSRQKAGYARALATAVMDGLDLAALKTVDDDRARALLMAQPGIGQWTADVYLAMCLLRPDVWPNGDQALATAATEVLALSDRPTFDRLRTTAEGWRPYRAVAARILWHHYLRLRGLSAT